MTCSDKDTVSAYHTKIDVQIYIDSWRSDSLPYLKHVETITYVGLQ